MGASQVFNSGTGGVVSPNVDLKRITAVFTRPADTTQYSAGDVVGPAVAACQTFALAARYPGGGGRILEILLSVDLELITTATFRLHFFNTTLTPQADNAAFTGLSTNPATYLGYVDPPILVTQAGGTFAAIRHSAGVSATSAMPFNYQCLAGSQSIFMVITALGTYTPKNAGIIRTTLTVERY